MGRSDLNEKLPNVPAAARDTLAENLGVVPSDRLPGFVADASREAFVHALQIGLKVGAAVAFAGAIVAWRLVQSQAVRTAQQPVPVEA